MGLDSKQQVVKAAVGAMVLVLGVAGTGCGRSPAASESDRKAADFLASGDYAGAAREKEAAPLLVTLAAGQAADAALGASIADFRKFNDQQLGTYQTLWQASRLTGRVDQIVGSTAALAKYDPRASLGQVDSTLAKVQGQAGEAWTPADVDAAIPTIATANATIVKLKDQIAEVERTLASQVQNRDELAQRWQQLADQSNAAKGQQSVDLFKQAAEVRQQACEATALVEKTQLSLVPLRQELATAQSQLTTVTGTVQSMTDLRADIETSWRGISAQASQRAAYARLVYGTPDVASSVMGKTRLLVDAIADLKKTAESYDQQLQTSLGFARDGVVASDKAAKDLNALIRSEGAQQSGLLPAWKSLQATADPADARFVQGCAAYSAGNLQASQARLLQAQAMLAEQLVVAAEQVHLSAPGDFTAETFKKAQAEANGKAAASLKDASEQFQTAADAVLASPGTKQAAGIGRLISLSAAGDVANSAGDAAVAKQCADDAKATRDQLQAAGAKFYLPASVGGPLAPAPATAPQ